VLHEIGEVVARIPVRDREPVDAVEFLTLLFDPVRSPEQGTVEGQRADDALHNLLLGRCYRKMRVTIPLVAAVMKVPQARSMTVIRGGQFFSVAMLVRS